MQEIEKVAQALWREDGQIAAEQGVGRYATWPNVPESTKNYWRRLARKAVAA